jgi:hypothetical protein
MRASRWQPPQRLAAVIWSSPEDIGLIDGLREHFGMDPCFGAARFTASGWHPGWPEFFRRGDSGRPLGAEFATQSQKSKPNVFAITSSKLSQRFRGKLLGTRPWIASHLGSSLLLACLSAR